MSTIPAYLTTLADLVDKHGTHAKGMGPELRLIAGLPWPNPEQVALLSKPPKYKTRGMRPCDVARGWLLCAKTRLVNEEFMRRTAAGLDASLDPAAGRAAACAELAVLSMRWTVALRNVARGASAQPEQEPAACPSERVVFVDTSGPTETIEFIRADPHDGTIEGARAAWGFIASQAKRMGTRGIQKERLAWNAIEDVYRRELEAMK